ncbi:hypothetical protein B0T16DRAFT_145591 [Cercophora newfieldiana]|uniref:Ribosomal protein S21 n=1 Tax=Cercophora newfieldiana TaxID=92897 RepID=A0AA39Y616_9PEZI|nr:hypothetical protein B0T16DRAFT_145591 [Cercophora newfieldiana]
MSSLLPSLRRTTATLTRRTLLATPTPYRPFSSTLPSLSNSNSPSNATLTNILQNLGATPNDPSLVKPAPVPRPPPAEGSSNSIPSRLSKSLQKANTSTFMEWEADDFASKYKDRASKEVTLRLDTTLGRNVNVTRTMPVEKALQRLAGSVSRNRVFQEWRSRKFHERPALKRKRLRRERSEARFAQSVRAAITRTMELRQMGW